MQEKAYPQILKAKHYSEHYLSSISCRIEIPIEKIQGSLVYTIKKVKHKPWWDKVKIGIKLFYEAEVQVGQIHQDLRGWEHLRFSDWWAFLEMGKFKR